MAISEHEHHTHQIQISTTKINQYYKKDDKSTTSSNTALVICKGTNCHPEDKDKHHAKQQQEEQ
eukprot:6682733-Ditylum_brightwellii.AAC.1